MRDFRSLETSVLVDLLAIQTDNYTRILSEGSSQEDYARCILTIKAIQTEIESRKQSGMSGFQGRVNNDDKRH